MKKLLVSLLFVVSSVAYAACDQLVAWGYPKPQQPTIALCHIAYYTAWNPATKNPAYSAEYLLEENVSGTEERQGSFKQHPNIDSKLQATNEDYARSGFDRGHMAAAGNMRKDSAAMEQSFYLTNMVPQYPQLNRGIWAALERYVRLKVTPERPVFVITGPIYGSDQKTIGKGVWVPSHTFKVVYDLRGNKVSSYVIPNVPGVSGKLNSFYQPYTKVQELAGIDFFPQMSVDVKKFLKDAPLDREW
jgi:endonuclease G